MGTHRLLARCLADRAPSLSEDPGRETVRLTGHGCRQYAADREWLAPLERLAERMRAAGGDGFRAIRVATWCEKREQSVASIREMVRKVSRDGGRALLIPARTTGTGPAEELLPDMDFALGEGFVSHPLFEDWLHAQVQTAFARYREEGRGRLGASLMDSE
ncbi:hypothetical protein [Thiohalorhabdus sp.]|uniref:hypothetical protein n=1 Tax=Thiohalorhabdus sp. TaxID=3094134 RepID=UPI002FC369F2